jgi:hypothetical protein
VFEQLHVESRARGSLAARDELAVDERPVRHELAQLAHHVADSAGQVSAVTRPAAHGAAIDGGKHPVAIPLRLACELIDEAQAVVGL